MLLLRSGPVTVTGYRQFEKDGQPQIRRDGSAIEFVCYLPSDESHPRETTIDPSINGGRPEVGEVVELVMESRPYEDARTGRSGRPYIHRGTRERVARFERTKAAA